jgi:peptidoglycan/xylan/chitin deacetylase (PgdA/CDA1 family)
MMRALFSMLSRGGAHGRMSIFIFHRVLDEPDPLFPDEIHARRFDELCGWIAQWFNVLPLEEAVVRLRAGTLPARAAAITFDDGYEDNHRVAMPILQRHGLTATFFIATGFLDGGCMWNDVAIEAARRCTAPSLDACVAGLEQPLPLGSWLERRQAAEAVIGAIKYQPVPERLQTVRRLAEQAGVAIPADLMMRSDQVLDMHRQGMSIGAHTIDHPILATLDRDAIRAQIEGSRRILSHITGQEIDLFAYPNGKPGKDYDEVAVQVVQELGFTAAVSTAPGAVDSPDRRFELPRFTPWDRQPLRFGVRLASTYLRQ